MESIVANHEKNLLPTGQAGVQLVSSLIFTFLSDFWQNRPIFLAITSVYI